MKKIKYVSLSNNFKLIKNDLFFKFSKTGKRGDFILGNDVIKFEKAIKKFTKSKYVSTCANGTDAIEIALKVLNIKKNDQVITASNTWISVANAIINVGAKPVFVDINHSLNIDVKKIKQVINNKVKCIIITHLNGLPADIKNILDIAKKYKLKVIEDCSQAIGSKYYGKHVGNFADIATFSLHPTKNLGVFGDGGFITTNKKEINKKFRILRNNGLLDRDKSKYIGRNSRLDNFQAIVGSLLLKSLNQRLLKRIKNALLYKKYLEKIIEIKFLPTNFISNKIVHTFHRYVIQCEDRDNLMKYLIKNGIEAKIHYPINIHEQSTFSRFYKKNLKKTNLLNKKIISLPIHEYLSSQDISFICKKIKIYFNEK